MPQQVWHKEFSNFAPLGLTVTLKGQRLHFDCAEKLYCYIRIDEHKPGGPTLREQIRTAPGPAAAKRLSYDHRDLWRSDWDTIKLDVMTFVLKTKFKQHWATLNPLMEQLNGAHACEFTRHDPYWGLVKNDHGQWVGDNHLGRLITAVWTALAIDNETW